MTASTDGGRALLQSDRVARLFIGTIFSYRDQRKVLVHEFVVMPNHVHLLISPAPNVTIERVLQFIKGGFSYRAKKELAILTDIWQRGYVDHRVRDRDDYAQHRAYIHANPVRARLATKAAEFPYSSAFPGFMLDDAPQGLKPGV